LLLKEGFPRLALIRISKLGTIKSLPQQQTTSITAFCSHNVGFCTKYRFILNYTMMSADLVAENTKASNKDRKEAGRRLKRQRIEESGGVRPREPISSSVNHSAAEEPPSRPSRKPHGRESLARQMNTKRSYASQQRNSMGSHRFGRVMDAVPCRGKPRFSTVSIAIPGSVVSNCQTRELRTQMVGQLARAATIYHVDEIIVFDDKLAKEMKPDRGYYQRSNHHGGSDASPRSGQKDNQVDKDESSQSNRDEPTRTPSSRSDPHEFMARVFQYCECPQYLRRDFFPMHGDLQYAGLLAPMDAPHHVRVNDRARFREGIVLEKTSSTNGNSLVHCGIRGRPVEIDVKLTPGIRCTVQLDPKASYETGGKPNSIIRGGKVVSPSAPRKFDGTYWGYTTRLASSIKAVFDECPFGVYDLKVGTSERGSTSLDDGKFRLPSYQHALIVFGGVAGIEECVDADESLSLPGSQSRKLFDLWVNICPFQGSRTIRTEEAVLIALAKLSPLLSTAVSPLRTQDKPTKVAAPPILQELPDEDSLSEESSGSASD
jgi:hypothetical protein